MNALRRNIRTVRGGLQLAAAILSAVGVCAAAKAPPTGVRPTEIVVGTHMDLSGPLSALGTAVRNGLQLAFGEVNAAGGIYGRKLRLVARDDAYSAKKALGVTRTLLFRDRIFALLCPVGTPPVARTMPLVLNNHILHLFPFAPVDGTYIPNQSLEFAIDLPVKRQISIGLHTLLASRGPLKVGVLHRSDALGISALQGASAELAREGARLAAIVSFRPGESNFTAQLATLHDSGVELVVMGGVAQEAITAMQQAAAEGWFPLFLCDSACYVAELPALGGRTVSGLYAVATTPIPYPDDKDVKLRHWVRRYELRYGTVASVDAFRAYLNARMFAEAVRRAGPDPTEHRVARALEAMSPWRDPLYGGTPVVFTPRDHIGFRTGFLAQVRNGRWTTLANMQTADRRTR